MDEWDFDPSLEKGYRLQEHVPGYTGFIPKLQQNFASTFTVSTRIAMSCPPTPDVETMEIDFHKARRRLQTAAPLSGTGFMGFVDEPEEQKESTNRYKQYWQGSQVNLPEYYEDQKRKVDIMRKENPKSLTQKKNPVRNASQIRFGDYYYYVGKHMYESTLKESYDDPKTTAANISQRAATPSTPSRQMETGSMASSSNMSVFGKPGWKQLDDLGRTKLRFKRSKHTMLSLCPEHNEEEPILYRYKVAEALVGSKRVDRLAVDMNDRVTSKIVTANKDMMKLFDMYAMIGKGLGHSVIGYEEFRCIGQQLGVRMSVKEALALFGRYDQMSDDPNGFLEYFEFISLVFGNQDGKQNLAFGDDDGLESP